MISAIRISRNLPTGVTIYHASKKNVHGEFAFSPSKANTLRLETNLAI